MPQSSKWRASFSPLTCNEYLLSAIALAMHCGTGRRNVGQSSATRGSSQADGGTANTTSTEGLSRRVDRSHIFACFTPSLGQLSPVTEQ